MSFSAFLPAFAALGAALFTPLHLVLAGMVLRKAERLATAGDEVAGLRVIR